MCMYVPYGYSTCLIMQLAFGSVALPLIHCCLVGQLDDRKLPGWANGHDERCLVGHLGNKELPSYATGCEDSRELPG